MPSRREAIGDGTLTGCPQSRISPSSGWYAPVITLRSVDLPAPFSPIKARISPALTSIETRSRARTFGNVFVMPTSSSCGTGVSKPVSQGLRAPPAKEERDPTLTLARYGVVVSRDQVALDNGSRRDRLGLRYIRIEFADRGRAVHSGIDE